MGCRGFFEMWSFVTGESNQAATNASGMQRAEMCSAVYVNTGGKANLS